MKVISNEKNFTNRNCKLLEAIFKTRASNYKLKSVNTRRKHEISNGLRQNC